MSFTVIFACIGIALYLMIGRGTVLMLRHLDGERISNLAMLWVPLVAIAGVVNICLMGEKEFIRTLEEQEDYYE